MKKLRGIILAGGANYDNFPECLKNIQRSFETACTDLRSQVVREACITLAFLSQQLKNKFASFAEAVLLHLMNLIQNSAKVIQIYYNNVPTILKLESFRIFFYFTIITKMRFFQFCGSFSGHGFGGSSSSKIYSSEHSWRSINSNNNDIHEPQKQRNPQGLL